MVMVSVLTYELTKLRIDEFTNDESHGFPE